MLRAPMAKPKMYVWQAQVGERKKMEGNCVHLSGVGNKQLMTMLSLFADWFQPA